MVFAQGALGYGLTSIMGAVVLEIFQGKHYGSIFGTIMLAALAGGAAGTLGHRLSVRPYGKLYDRLCDRDRRERIIRHRDLAGVSRQNSRSCRPVAPDKGNDA